MGYFERARRRKQIKQAVEAFRNMPHSERLPEWMHSRIEALSGKPALAGESVHDHLARAVGMPRADVDRFVALIEAGHSIEEAERAVPSAARVLPEHPPQQHASHGEQ